MPKQYVKFRVGFLDHLPAFATNPDALVVYNYCLLTAPMSGPEAGCVRLHHTLMAERFEWSRWRVSRAVKWLLANPSPSHPMLILVERGRRNQPGRYVIPRYETSENTGRFGDAGAPKPSRFGADSVTPVHRNGKYGADSVTQVHRNLNKERARSEREVRRTKRGADAVYEKTEWITVRSENEAREALLNQRGYAMLPEAMQDDAIETAMKNLEFYHIRYEPEDDAQEAAG